MSQGAIRKRVFQVAAVVSVHACVACLLTWPLAARFGSSLPMPTKVSEFDTEYSAWALAWESHALAGPAKIADANIYYPEPDALFYGPVGFGALPIFAPVFWLTANPTLAINFVFLGSIVLTAACIHLVVHAWTRMHAAGFVAAATFLCSRWLLWNFVAPTPHIAALFCFPAIIFLAARPRRPIAEALLLGLVIWQCFTDCVYVAPSVLLPLAALGAFRVLHARTRTDGLRLLVTVLVAAVVTAGVHAPYLSVAARNPHLAAQTNWQIVSAAFLFEVPSDWWLPRSPVALPTVVPLLIVAGGILMLRRSRRVASVPSLAWRHAAFWTIAGFVLSLPIRARLGGNVFVLPHWKLLRQIAPTLAAIRLPERLAVVSLIGTAILAGLAFSEIFVRKGPASGWRAVLVRSAAALLVGGLLYLQYAFSFAMPRAYGGPLSGVQPGGRFLDGPLVVRPYPLRSIPATDSDVLRPLREQQGPTIEVPIPRRKATLANFHATAMFRSIFHWQPLLNGYSSYWPERFAPLMKTAMRLPESAALEELREETGLEFILARVGKGTLDKESRVWSELAERGGGPDLEVLSRDANLILFRVKGSGENSSSAHAAERR